MDRAGRITILGAGSWGMALARHIALTGHPVTVWARNREKLDFYDRERVYPGLSDMPIPSTVVFEPRMERAVPGSSILILAVPSLHMRAVSAQAAPFVRDGVIAVSVAKGIEASTLMSMSEIIGEEFMRAGATPRLVALSGPTHAEEVALDLPTTIVSASTDREAARIVQDALMDSTFRVYTNSDIRGVEYCGALKNIMALASGISEGLGYGDNARAALITRALSEMARLGDAMGVRRDTLFGLAGVGDLIVTCTSMHSRNNRAGILIGRGMKVEDALESIGMVVEGVNALPAAVELARRHKVEMPILFAVDSVVRLGADPGEAVISLMMRDKKDEID